MRILNIDMLSVMEESELKKLMRRVKSIVNHSFGKQKASAQVELCYLQRETEIRRNRKKAHEEFLTELAS